MVLAALLAPIAYADRAVESFLRQGLSHSTSARDLRLFARFAQEIGRPDFALSAAKKALWKNLVLVPALYPRLSEKLSNDLDSALVHALVRQESTFDSRAVSRAGARGLMQLMPATARLMAREMKTSYRLVALTEDPAYNLSLGQGYLRKLLDRFSGSYILALAGYNAGPGRAEKWMKTYGDPRHPVTDPVTWIESIPFNETRNYVQRILESVTAYHWLASGGEVVLPAHLAAPMVPAKLP
jgi:soluble lytic murein transglycosylase